MFLLCVYQQTAAFRGFGARRGSCAVSAIRCRAVTGDSVVSSTPTTTRYTIDTPPIDAKLLKSTVFKNFANFDRYLTSRPVAAHTAEAFAQFQAELADDQTSGFILDSGCGTGRSSLVLGEQYPDKMVVGVDRSIDRLGRVARDLTSTTNEGDVNGTDDDEDSRQHVQRVRYNVILVRAELVHFCQQVATSRLSTAKQLFDATGNQFHGFNAASLTRKMTIEFDKRFGKGNEDSTDQARTIGMSVPESLMSAARGGAGLTINGK